MNTSKTVNAQISAFADGELHAEQHEQLLKALREPAVREAWDAYHLIGDSLRSSDTAVHLSDGFADRMAARLAAEPSFLGTPESMSERAAHGCNAQQAGAPAAGSLPAGPRPPWRRMAIPGAAMAATVLLAVAVGPRLQASHADGAVAAAKPAAVMTVGAASREEQTVLRNPQIDEYLVAHQRFSPSLYSTAQYARPSTFATESSK